MTRGVPFVLALGLGCTSSDSPPARVEPAKVEPPNVEPAKVEPPKVEPPKIEPPKPVPATFVAGERTHILVERHDDTAARAQVLAVTLEGAIAGSEVNYGALAMPYWEGHFAAVAGHGGGKDWATGESDGKGFRVVLRQIGETATTDVAVPHAPAAIHVAGPTVIVGAGPTVGSISLMRPSPSWALEREREDMQGKAFDGFARAGDWLVAVDDQIVPMFADSFTLAITGRPIHRAGWEMPGVINGHYVHPVLVPASTGERDGTLFVVAPYGIMDGHGHDLAALPIRADELDVPADFTVNSSRSAKPPVLEEHVPRGRDRPLSLAAGTEYTEWGGLAVHGEHLLAAAGTRGLFVIPVGFTPDTKATVIDVGGECRDVLVADDRIWVLVGGTENALVAYLGPADAAKEQRRVPLPSSFTGIVD